jgi:hypothetical protein
MKYPKSDIFFFTLFIMLFLLSVLCSCGNTETLSIEDRINAVVPSEDGRTARITIGDRTFLFTEKTMYVDSWGGYFSGRQNVQIDESITGRYCLAGWGKDGETLLLLDVSGWQQPVFTRRGI